MYYQSLTNAAAPCTYFIFPYADKPDELDGEGVKYYVTETNEYTKCLVTQFIMYNYTDGCNISMEQYFTSIALAEWALMKSFTIVGTMKLD